MAAAGTGSETFPKLLLGHAEQRGNRPAIREKSRGIWHTMSWRDLATEAGALAAGLAARGVRRGSHVALVSDNRPRFYAAICAAHALGAVAAPLYQDASADELAVLLTRAGATHVFAENQEQVDKLLSILSRCPAIACIVYDDDRGMRHYKQPQLVSYAALVQQGKALATSKGDLLQAEAARSAGGDPAFLIFTSGTTGPAKGVVLTHASLIDRARAAAAAEGINDTDVAMAYLPPGWIGQTFFGYVQPMVTGCCVACPESSETMLADMRETGPTRFLAPPRVLETLLTQVSLRIEDAGRFNQALYQRAMDLARRVGARILAGESVSFFDRIAYAAYDLLVYGPLRDVLGLSRVRVAYTAGDVVHPELLMYFRAIGINLKQLYGSTETGFFVAMQPDGEVRPDTVGRVAAGVELKFTAEREILVRSRGLFSEYHGDPASTAQSRNAEGWFRTGDAGYLGEDGHLRVLGAIASVGALADGTPYAPKVLENRLKFHPYVREAVIVGAGRDRVCALIDIDPTTTGRWADRQSLSYTGHADLASLQEVQALVGECVAAVNEELARDAALAKSQIHRYVVLAKELDADDGLLTRTGKLRRAAIAERFGALVDAMYAGGAEADGLRVGNAKTSAPARKAA